MQNVFGYAIRLGNVSYYLIDISEAFFEHHTESCNFFDNLIDNTLKNFIDMLITLDHSINKHP